MSSWIPWAQATNPQFEELVEKACSPLNLPDTQDIPLQLEICDLVRSKTVPARAAMLSLRARIAAKNPRVQLAAWQLADVCIKNGGDHFLREVAGREFVDECVGVIKAGANPQVGERARALWQSWALAFEGRPELALVTDTYRQLKAEGIQFPPPPPTIPSHLLTTSTPPTWLDSDACMRCRTPFSFTNRKHHCRACGLVFDQACSSRTAPLPHLGIPEPVRVCEACFAKRQQKTDAPAVPTKRTLRTGGKGYDADLQRAIALSLAESQQPGYVPSQPGRMHEGTDAPGKPDDEDEELRLAIEASLDEMRRHAAPSAPPAGPSSASADAPEYKPLPTYDLSPREAETVLSFAQTVDHAVAFGDPDFRRFPHVHALHDQAAQVAGKLLRNIEEKHTKSQMLGEMQEQLVRAIKRYEEVLTEQDAFARRQAEQRRQQQPAYGYGYQPPEQGYQPHGQGYPSQAYAYYPQQPSGSGMYPSMPSAPGPETTDPYANYPPQHAPPADYYPPHAYPNQQAPDESSNPYAAQAYPQSSAPPLGSPPAAEYARYPGIEAQQPPMASQAYAQSSAPPLGSPPAAEHARYSGMELQQQQPLMSDQASAVAQQPTTAQSPPRGYSVPLHQPAQSHVPRQPQGYLHQQIAHDPPPAQAYQAAHATFPAFPDAPTQLPPPEPVVAEQPKEALLIEL